MSLPINTDNRSHLIEKVSAMAHRGMDSVRDTSHLLRVKAEHASDSTVNYVKDEPIKSVLIAARGARGTGELGPFARSQLTL